MARVSLHGMIITAEPVRQLENGDWIMVAKQHGPRCSIGTEIQVRLGDIEEMAAAETPPADGGHAALDAAMAEERKTLPTVQELLAQNAAAKAAYEQEPSHVQETEAR